VTRDATSGGQACGATEARRPRPRARTGLREAVARCRSAGRVCLLLDYDGTLVDLARTPAEAAPDAEVLALVSSLARSPRFDVHIISGRPREDLAGWFGHLPVTLWAEHALWRRLAGQSDWRAAARRRPVALRAIGVVLEEFVVRTPGSWVEHKSASLAWHYRLSSPSLAVRRAHELRERLGPLLRRHGFGLLYGRKVVEVRRDGVSKALVARWLAANGAPGRSVLAFGDDQTDDELFAELPANAVSVSVGQALPHAKYALPSPRHVRQLLMHLAAAIDAARVSTDRLPDNPAPAGP
jgi:trehalose 6-phosphate synthase/phosphatase